MGQQSNLEESSKIAREAKFATIGRAIADHAKAGHSYESHAQEAALLRWQEHNRAEFLTQFAALTRQLGDARRNGKDESELISKLIALRRAELGPAVTS